jgi:hypothetical protein
MRQHEGEPPGRPAARSGAGRPPVRARPVGEAPVHDAEPGTPRRTAAHLVQLQRLAGNRATAGYVSRSVQRRIVVDGPTTLAGEALPLPQNVLTPRQRKAFAVSHRAQWSYDGRPRAELAGRVIADLAATSDDLKFGDEAELVREVVKRVTTASGMRTSQGVQVHGHWLLAFGYPNRPPAGAGVGPRVNEAALAYWNGPTGSGSYEFQLTPLGRAHAFAALQALFTLQRDPKKRTLIHCDYLTSVLHMKAFAEAIGEGEFDRRVATGVVPLTLKWNGFNDITESPGFGAGRTSLRFVEVATENDFVIGDHVVFYNHPLYDALIAGVGGVWRLENAILVDRQGSTDLFQGHGYPTPVTKAHMFSSMRQKITQHVDEVRGYISGLHSRNPAVRARAAAGLARYVNVHLVAGRYRIQGPAFGGAVTVDEPLRVPATSELPGLHHFQDGKLYARRPVESE